MIDITFVSGARPDLMEATLASFQENMFQNIEVRKAFFNIDPIFGGPAEVTECEQLAKKYFPKAIIFKPTKPSFGAAVKRLWMETSDLHVFHLEDDWNLLHTVTSTDLSENMLDDVGMVQLAIQPRGYYGGEYLYITKRKRIFGYEIFSKKVHAYGTSPRFIRSGLCKKYGDLLKPNLDPEKQVYKNKNYRLSRAHQKWKCKILYGPDDDQLILDTGREWRNQRAIQKIDYRGKAKWVTK